jgi:flagellar hook-length control protein FliK
MPINALKIATRPVATQAQGESSARAGAANAASPDFKHTLAAHRAIKPAPGQTAPDDQHPPAHARQARAGHIHANTLQAPGSTITKHTKAAPSMAQTHASIARMSIARASNTRTGDARTATPGHASQARQAAANVVQTTHITRRLLIAYHAPAQGQAPRAPAKATTSHKTASAATIASAARPTRAAQSTAAEPTAKNKADKHNNSTRAAPPEARATHKTRLELQDKSGDNPNTIAPPPGVAALVGQPPVAPVNKKINTGDGQAEATHATRRATARDATLARLADQTSHGEPAGAGRQARQAATRSVADRPAFKWVAQQSHGEHADSPDAAGKTDAGNTPVATPGPASATPANPNAAANAPAASTAPAITATLAAPIGGDAWNAALTQQSLHLNHSGGQAVLNLHPRELGPLQVSLSVSPQNQQAQLHFVSPHADVRAAVEAALPQLRAAFAASGLSLGSAFVSDQGSQHSQSSAREDRRRAPDRLAPLAGPAQAATTRTSVLPGRTTTGGIDIFA